MEGVMIGVIEAAKALVGATGTLQRLGNERKAKLASHFDNISKVLQDFVSTRQNKQKKDQDLDDKIGDKGPCAELAVYAEKMRELASHTLQAGEVEHLAKVLANACQNWQKLTPDGAPGNHLYDTYLGEIAEAAGHFQGFANVLRAM